MIIQDKKVLVTGAEGFIGSHLVEALVSEGAKVTALVQYNSFNNWGWLDTFHPSVKCEIEVKTGDIREFDSISKIVEGKEVVFHLAALIAIPYSYQSPAAYVRTNVEGTLNVMEACKNNSVQKVVHTSTSEVYGTAQYVPIDEKHPLQGQSPYSASKIGADMIVESFYRSFDLPVSIMRPFNNYGPRQSLRAVIPTIITQFLGGDKKLKLGSVDTFRDFLYVKDTARCFVKMAECNESVGRVVNIGTGMENSILEVAQKVASALNMEYEIETDILRVRPEKSEVSRLLCNNNLAKELLGWAPHYTFEEGLKETIQWFESNMHFYKPDIYNI